MEPLSKSFFAASLKRNGGVERKREREGEGEREERKRE